MGAKRIRYKGWEAEARGPYAYERERRYRALRGRLVEQSYVGGRWIFALERPLRKRHFFLTEFIKGLIPVTRIEVSLPEGVLVSLLLPEHLLDAEWLFLAFAYLELQKWW